MGNLLPLHPRIPSPPLALTGPWSGDLTHEQRTLVGALWNTGSCYDMDEAACWAYCQTLHPDAQHVTDIPMPAFRVLIGTLLDALDPEPDV